MPSSQRHRESRESFALGASSVRRRRRTLTSRLAAQHLCLPPFLRDRLPLVASRLLPAVSGRLDQAAAPFSVAR